jgi:hypothetical protein
MISDNLLFYEIQRLYEKRDFKSIVEVCKKRSVSLSAFDNNSDYNLPYLICENLDKEGVEFCLAHGCTIYDFNYASRSLLRLRSPHEFEKRMEFLDYLLEKGMDIWNIFHYSLAWSRLDAHEHLLNNWINEIYDNITYIYSAFETAAAFGEYDSIKYIMSKEIYREYIDDALLENAFRRCIGTCKFFDKKHIELIDYFVNDLNRDITRFRQGHKNSVFINKYLARHFAN